MIREVTIVWSVILLLPLIPVVLLYVLFGSVNFFQLEDVAKGVLATGPIAAYIFIVGIGWSIYPRLHDTLNRWDPSIKAIQGSWKFQAVSAGGSQRDGVCQISQRYGRLNLSGTFEQDGETVGTWSSELATIKDGTLYMWYTLREIRDGQAKRSDGTCILFLIGQSSISSMCGSWLVVGEEGAAGTIRYERP